MALNLPLIIGVASVVALAWSLEASPLRGVWKSLLSVPTLAALVCVVWLYA